MRPGYVAGFAFVIAAPFGVASRSTTPQPIRPESRIWFTGASNIRHFTCKAGRLSGNFQLRGEATGREVLVGRNASTQASLVVTVDRLDCGIGIMNRHLHEALAGARHPTIEFRLTTSEVDLRAPLPIARIAGQVTIAGVQRPVVATAGIHVDSFGTLYLRGEYVIHPTDFAVVPPRRFGGLLRVRDGVTVHFDVAV